jgi:hypothetical protein
MLSDSEIVIQKVVQAFDQLDISYLVGGSIASSLYGVPRFTQDVDFVADMREEHAPALVAALQGEFYVDEDMIRDALLHQSSFNVIHLHTMHKADIFIRKRTEWADEEWARRCASSFDFDGDIVPVYLASPEDTVLQKLVWFRMGGGVSDRQRGDVQSVLEAQAGALDYGYLRRWATELGVSDLLEEALAAAGE